MDREMEHLDTLPVVVGMVQERGDAWGKNDRATTPKDVHVHAARQVVVFVLAFLASAVWEPAFDLHPMANGVFTRPAAGSNPPQAPDKILVPTCTPTADPPTSQTFWTSTSSATSSLSSTGFRLLLFARNDSLPFLTEVCWASSSECNRCFLVLFV